LKKKKLEATKKKKRDSQRMMAKNLRYLKKEIMRQMVRPFHSTAQSLCIPLLILLCLLILNTPSSATGYSRKRYEVHCYLNT
jgi:hypothetical protein